MLQTWRLPAQLLFILTVLLLIGCASPSAVVVGEPLQLPTRAAVAQIEIATPTPTPDRNGIPPTWTPSAVEIKASKEAFAGRNGQPTATPTPQATVPTSTPTAAPPTATPLPTATRPYRSAIPTLPPTDELGPSKLGIHVIQNNDPRIMAFIREAQPAIVKAVGDLGFLAEVKQVSPTTITIGRIDDIYAQNYDVDPVKAAREYVDKHLASLKANPGVDYWEGWNEPDPNVEFMRWYAAYEAERVRLLAAHGLRAAVGGFATGVPELYEFRQFLPAIQAAKDHGGILSLHEYGAPDMTYLYGAPLPGYPSYADRGALTFRYRWFYEEILKPVGLVIPLAITEAGVDGIIGDRPGPGGKGWRDFGTYWIQQGWGATATEAYLNQLAWYDAGVRQDGYVIGFTVFTAGDVSGWQSYEIDSILPQLAQYVVGQR